MRKSEVPCPGRAGKTSLVTSCSLALSPSVWQLVIGVHRTCWRCQSLCWPGSLNDCPEQGLPCLLPPRTTPDSLPLPTSCSLCQQNRNPYMKPWNSEFFLFQPGVYFMKREWKLKSGDPSRSRPPSKNQERSLAMISCGYFCCVFFFLKFAKVKCFSYKW